MTSLPNVVHSQSLPEEDPGQLLRFSRESVEWEWMSMAVRRLRAGEIFSTKTEGEEAAFVVLGGRCVADWGAGAQSIGKRNNVFEGLPYCLYLPTGNSVQFIAETGVEIAECRVPSTAKLEPKLITPQDVVSSLRGGGNASRQIVDIIRPDFPADKLVVIEVYTPEEIGPAIRRTNTTFTTLPPKWILMRFIIIGSTSRARDLPCNDCIVRTKAET